MNDFDAVSVSFGKDAFLVHTQMKYNFVISYNNVITF